MNNKFITEISEEDFRKLNLIGYDNERVENADGSYSFKFFKKDLNEKLDEYKKYLLELIEDGHELPWTIAVCVHYLPTDESLAYYINNFKNIETGGKLTAEEAYHLALYDFSYYDKWMDKAGHTTYEFGVGIDHLYSTRDKWIAKDWLDYFEVRKRETKAVYIIHLEGKPGEYIKNGTD